LLGGVINIKEHDWREASALGKLEEERGMPELRKDPIVDRWVIISPERNQRPSDFPLQPGTHPPKACPFCPGNEEMTPNEVLAYRSWHTMPNTPGWTVRVVPNKYPAVRAEGTLGERIAGLFGTMNGLGAHEVIIETSDHDASLATLPLCHVEKVLWAFRDRLFALRQDRRLRSALIFKNHGAAAGATLEHPHAQLIALPMIPKSLRDELEGCGRYYRERGLCIFCNMIQQEVQLKRRVILENAAFIALTPFASRFPFEIWILPKGHEASFEKACGEAYRELAVVLQEVLRRAFRLLDDPPYNIALHSAPWCDAYARFYHWHLEIMPRLTGVAGFEWGTGFHINATPPEEAACALRGVFGEARD
jgi:UDPglucose--hexose-1-phosphate uridylyltransferase